MFQKHWGAEFIADDVVRFRVWAEGQQTLQLQLTGREALPMRRAGDGWFEVDAAGVRHGDTYQYRLADGSRVADPASQAQQGDVYGPSQIIDPRLFKRRCPEWRGRPWEESVIYELHIGAFTPDGTFRSAMNRLPYLAALGVTVLEVMPVAQFAGERGWGYDGVLLYAPHSAYGTPEDFNAFIDEAHMLGISVVLDVVLNPIGQAGSCLSQLSPGFFDPDHCTIACEKEPVRQYIADAPLYWLTAYRLDGLRFAAVDQICDTSDRHVLFEIAERIRETMPDRHIHLITENSRKVLFLHPRDEQGRVTHYTAEWNADFHHAAHALATGETQGYYRHFSSAPEKHFAQALAEGFAYQGEISPLADSPQGEFRLGSPPQCFIDFIQNHDRVGNRACGERLTTLAGVDNTRILYIVMLLSPQIPLLFMGDEYGETRPFLFFTDFDADPAQAVREEPASEVADRAGSNDVAPDPNDPQTFYASKLDWKKGTWGENKQWLWLTHNLIALRQRVVVPLLSQGGAVAGRVLHARNGAIAVSWTFGGVTLSLSLNLGDDAFPLSGMPGETIFSWPTVDDVLPPRSIVVRLDDATSERRADDNSG